MMKSIFASSLVCALFAVQFASAAETIHFSRNIRPILSENCFLCHGPDEGNRKGDLRLDLEAAAKRDRKGTVAVVPGKPEQSAIIQRLEAKDPDEVMPPPASHKVISPAQVQLLKAWIRQGAPWGGHWSYEKVVRPAVPTGSESNPIDAFLAARLAREKLSFSPEADAATLVRRVALDLTGLPATLAETAEFATDPNAPPSRASYEKLVRHYLNKPAYGEHWARMWLDLARYADSAGYPSDPGREIWAYRDWVIRALNANMPFDQFTIEQIAGDLLPNPTNDQLTATAFHRNTMTNNEGGTEDEEFRIAAVVDRVNTTLAVWMGTTVACAQCHTHKYDPITIGEYYQLYDFFNQSADADKRDESPLRELLSPEVQQQRAEWKKQIAAIEAKLAKPTPAWLEGYEGWLDGKPKLHESKAKDAKLKEALVAAKDKRTEPQTKLLQQYYVRYESPASADERRQLETMTQQLAKTKPVTVPIMQDLPAAQHRTTRIQLRGNRATLGDEVHAGVPAAFPPLAEGPRNRLTLARWLVDRENPLTARVTVNRLWESVFGIGIVRSSEEFGSQGDPPFHPELLDWLAAEFMDSGWDVKHLLTLIVTSRAYRQTSKSTPALNERDPDNRLLARGPRFRPTGEQLRDQALAVSGLLSEKMFGPPVRPARPNLGLTTAFGGSNDWTISTGDDRHRRSIYTETRRNSPYPSFTTFDAPNREVCSIRRGRTNTPLQAFVTLNDPVFLETHRALARRILEEGGKDTAERLRFAYRVCLGREPDAAETATLAKLFEQTLATYRDDAALAQKMATEPQGAAPKEADFAVTAAWTTVAGVIMNLDEFLMRR
jgi:hypothetical protein